MKVLFCTSNEGRPERRPKSRAPGHECERKGEVTTKAKLIWCKSAAKSDFLNDLIEYVLQVGADCD